MTQELPGYLVCGLSVGTALPLPGMLRYIPVTSSPDVKICRATVPEALDGADYVGPTWTVAGQRFLLNLPRIARILVVDGREILVQPAPGVTESDVVPFILSTGFAAILHQRGVLALHAATVAWEGRAIGLCGPTGTGKSTLAAALCRSGGSFVGDDIAAVRFDKAGVPMVVPDGRQHRLWADAVDHLGLGQLQGAPVRERLQKFHVTPSGYEAGGEPQPMPLAVVLLLRTREPIEPPAPPKITRLDLTDAAPLLREEVFRGVLAQRMARDAELFGQIAALLGGTRVFLLERTLGLEQLPATVAAVTKLMETPA